VRVGFVGLGSQGSPMARAIIDAGFETTLWARRSLTLEPFTDSGAAVAMSCRALAQASDLVGVCVFGDADVEEVVLATDGLLAGAAPGTVIAVHSTVHPDTCRRLATEAARRQVALVDAPVSGGGAAAAAGHLLVMVGGEPSVFERCLPVFSTYGDPVQLMGPVGSGQLAKLVNNSLMVANLALADEALALGRALGLDPGALAGALSHGSGRSFALGLQPGARSLPEGLLRKDVDLVRRAAEAAGAAGSPLLETAERGLAVIAGPGD